MALKTSDRKTEKIILGIDPGTNVMGFGIIQVSNSNASLIDLGVVQFKASEDHTLKLKQIFSSVINLIEKHLPDEMAIEAPFFGKNVQSMLKLGRAQGVAIAAAVSRELPVTEYSPRKVKQSVTGKGSASKEQVAAMIPSIIKNIHPSVISEEKLDASDALAVAICHFLQSKSIHASNRSGSWNSFIKSNPDRLA